ncbi:MAG TPA: class I SAM-dependent methyltransferase [Fodinibius sp.]|nr:class I SAM-dependent methyltransferase [Fodinibius sp.]
MRDNIWEAFAQEDAEYYIDTTYQEDQRAFFKSGRFFAKQTMNNALPCLKQTKRALEIGCGVGRLTFPHADVFEEVVAVDIAPTMLQKLKENASKFDYSNIQPFLADEAWTHKPIDYAYSYLVFQHIQDFHEIENYIKKIATCLKSDGGVAQLQFDTRPRSLAYKLRNSLPDWLLSQNQQKGIRRIRRNPERLEEIFAENNFEIIRQKDAGTAKHTYLLRKTSSS